MVKPYQKIEVLLRQRMTDSRCCWNFCGLIPKPHWGIRGEWKLMRFINS